MAKANDIRVGFIGLGSQGGPMARRIVGAGFPTLLWARRPEALAEFADTGAEPVRDLADLAARCDHIGICVVNDADVAQVCDLLLPVMRPGSRLAIHSTILPETCIAMGARAAACEIALIDAPVSGGAPGAAAGTMTVMAGGDADAIAAARPVFESFATLITHLGGLGAGQYAKLINNALMAANLALADAALGAGDTFGLDRAALVELVNASSGRSFSFGVRARMPSLAMFGHGAAMLSKDVRLLGEVLGDDAAYPPLRDAAMPFLERVAAAARET
jgi:3-hydroxyisobutyrate dehydrogenase